MSELIVISPETEYAKEAFWVSRMFEEGLERYHLRKPGWSKGRLIAFVQQIHEKYWSRFVLHQSYELVGKLDLAGYHLKDNSDALSEVERFQEVRRSSQSMSRSVHSFEALHSDSGNWDYLFLSPVFDSISKEGYSSKWTLEEIESVLNGDFEKPLTKCYALGGVDSSNINRCLEIGFDGVAVLGAVWNDADPLKAFGELKGAMNSVVIR